MVAPLVKHKVIHKRTKHFERHASHRFKRMGSSWRKPHGIDNPVRRRYKGNLPMPMIGYGTDNKYKHVLPNGFHKFRVQNVKDLELLLMHNRKYAAEIGTTVSTRKRQEIVKRAAELNIKVTNGAARLRSTESA